MPGPLYNVGTVALCAHAGQVTPAAPSARVLVMGSPAVMMGDPSTVAGCPFATPGGPMPCVTVQWASGATRVLIEGRPALVQSSMGTTIPNGVPATVVVPQTRVVGQ